MAERLDKAFEYYAKSIPGLVQSEMILLKQLPRDLQIKLSECLEQLPNCFGQHPWVTGINKGCLCRQDDFYHCEIYRCQDITSKYYSGQISGKSDYMAKNKGGQ